MPIIILGNALSPTSNGFLNAAGLAAVAALMAIVFQEMRAARDRAISVRSAMRELISRLDDLLRTSKQIKRQLRARDLSPDRARRKARLAWPEGGPFGNLGAAGVTSPYLIPTAFFEERMDELSRVQLALEECRQIVRVRLDLFSEERIGRLLKLIGYSEKYLKDVIEEFEGCRAQPTDQGYVVGANCIYLNDFLCQRWRPAPAIEAFGELERATDPKAAFQLINQLIDRADQYFKNPARVQERPDDETIPVPRRRTKSISDVCLRAALADMRQAVVLPLAGRASLRAAFAARWRR